MISVSSSQPRRSSAARTRPASARKARANVAHHYDLSGALYDLFLDADRQYSCAYFERDDMSLDAAQEKTNRSDYNALTTWGVFFNEEVDNYNIILLNSIKQRLEFPELKAMVLEEYKDWNPDTFIVEKKSNGAALYQEMRRMGIPISLAVCTLSPMT